MLRKLSRVARHFVERERPIILMYHRVAHVAHDPWQLAVRPDRFAEQIEALVQLRRVVPLRWLAAELARGRVPRKVAAITFDDGYADVLAEAKPVLERCACPATVFLVTGMIGKSFAFWWDELSRIILETPLLPTELEMEIAGRVYRWRTDDRATGSAEDGVGDGPALTRAQLHEELWRLLRPLEPKPRRKLLMRLCAWAGVAVEAESVHRPLAAEEVRRLAKPGFIDIGAHTVTHPALSSLDKAKQRSEIEGSRAACEELIGEPIRTFAYPFGDFDDTSAACVRDAGFACACTTASGRVSMRSDPMRLPRFTAGNWAGDDLVRRLTARF
ncbi:MAG TPA: polysaccharide deacetylase family protein [Stellaceae bacterium]|nr:polysaccharide deacetylase family protein [Stellaceae bacterium]